MNEGIIVNLYVVFAAEDINWPECNMYLNVIFSAFISTD